MSRPAIDRELSEAIGFRINDRRESLGFSQRRLASLAGCTRATICHVETGYCVPGGRLILSLCRALEISPNRLLGWEEDGP